MHKLVGDAVVAAVVGIFKGALVLAGHGAAGAAAGHGAAAGAAAGHSAIAFTAAGQAYGAVTVGHATLTMGAHGALHLTTTQAGLAGIAAVVLLPRTDAGKIYLGALKRNIDSGNATRRNGGEPEMSAAEIDKYIDACAVEVANRLHGDGKLTENGLHDIGALRHQAKMGLR